MTRLRLWLIYLLLGSDGQWRTNFGLSLVTRAILQSRGGMIEWRWHGRHFVAFDDTDIEDDEDDEEDCMCELQCNICLNTFDGHPDEPCKCPSCGSRDLSLA